MLCLPTIKVPMDKFRHTCHDTGKCSSVESDKTYLLTSKAFTQKKLVSPFNSD